MDDNQGRSQKNDTKKEKRRRWILIPLHILVAIGIAFLIGALVRAQHQITQITMIPTPGAVESVPQESLPLANATPSPTLTVSGGTGYAYNSGFPHRDGDTNAIPHCNYDAAALDFNVDVAFNINFNIA